MMGPDLHTESHDLPEIGVDYGHNGVGPGQRGRPESAKVTPAAGSHEPS